MQAEAPIRDGPETATVETETPSTTGAELTLSFHGVGVAVASDDSELLDAVRHTFAYFAAAAEPIELRIEHRSAKPDYDALPELTRSVATPRNITFFADGVNYIDYFGRALNVYDARRGLARVTTDDPHLAREIVYLTVLSRVAERLAARGIHRIHALGLELGGRAALVLLPSGGGKSTLALSILRDADNGLRLISEDSPLVRRDGWLLPFPLRIGVHPQNLPEGIEARFTRFERRMEFEPKVSIDVTLFADRLAREPVPPGLILLGRRTTARDSRIVPVAKRRVTRHILMNSVVGIGLYQGLEFILQRGLGDVAAHAATALSRSRGAFQLVRKSRVYEFVIGRDRRLNFETLLRFLAAEQPPSTR
ncbi:MAG: hypothetical protein ACREI7_03350 [Myxococcota bacterium]